MAGLTSGDGPVQSINGASGGQGESIAAASGALEDEQTLPDSEQTLADADQTLADADQTGSDSDQTSADRDQLAADRDQAASDRDLASGADPRAHEISHDIRERAAQQRDQAGEARVDVADQRDGIANSRDLAALARDQAADARDHTMAQSDVAYERDAAAPVANGSETDMLAAGRRRRKRAAQHHAQAAEQRVLAAQDRQAAGHDRAQAARDRLRAATDPLTGARAREAGLTDVAHELDRCRRTGDRLVVVYVDVVGLKTLNDSEGHGAGDELLTRVVALITAHVRSYDLVIRLGGDEFLCAMSNVTLLDARLRFSAIAAALAGVPQDGSIRAGFAELEPDETATMLIARADGDLVASRNGQRDGRPPPADETSANEPR